VCALLRVMSPVGVNDRVIIAAGWDGSTQEGHKLEAPENYIRLSASKIEQTQGTEDS
jgi:hypothetical protein